MFCQALQLSRITFPVRATVWIRAPVSRALPAVPPLASDSQVCSPMPIRAQVSRNLPDPWLLSIDARAFEAASIKVRSLKTFAASVLRPNF